MNTIHILTLAVICIIASCFVSWIYSEVFSTTKKELRELKKELDERFNSNRHWVQAELKYLNDYQKAQDNFEHVTACGLTALCEHLEVELKEQKQEKRIVVKPIKKDKK